MNELKGELKRYLIDYFDGVKFEVDIQAQTLFLKLEEGSKMRDDVFKMNQVMVDKAKEIYENNSKAVDVYFNSREQVVTNDLEELKAIIFNGFCVFYNKENHLQLDSELLLGKLIITDWYLDQNQLNSLRCLF